MPLFVLTCHDREGGLETRIATRPQHLAYLEGFKDEVKLAGPMLDGVDGAPNGSLLILDFPTFEAAQAFAAGDPYAIAGLFATVTLQPFRATIGSL